MTQRLLLVRHARTAAAHDGRLIGATDLPLDPQGRREAAALAARAARWSPDLCYVSPMQRCRETAAAILPGREFRCDDDLREMDFGRCEGRTFDELARDDPGLVERWLALGPDFAFPGGEAAAGFLARVRAAADRLAREESATVLAVSHSGVIRAMICHLLGLEPRHCWLFDVGYAGTVAIDLFECDGGVRGVLAALGPAPCLEDDCGAGVPPAHDVSTGGAGGTPAPQT